MIKVKAPFINEISGLAIVKILDGGTHSTLFNKIKIHMKYGDIRYSNKGTETMIFRTEEMMGIVDLRLLGYYKIKQGILQQTLSTYYKFERVEKLCEYFNKFVNMLKEEREEKLPQDKYLWLDPGDNKGT